MATKLVENVDEDIWNKFAGYCKMNDILIGPKLSDVLLKYLKEEGFE